MHKSLISGLWGVVWCTTVFGVLDTALADNDNEAYSVRALVERNGKLWQPVVVSIKHTGFDKDVVIRVGDVASTMRLKDGENSIELLVPPAEQVEERSLSVEGAKIALPSKVELKPARKLKIYILPHSHTDIGYTALQEEVEEQHVEYLIKAIELSRKTAEYPPGAQFKWNVEVLWPVDCYLRKMPEEKRAELIDAIKKGWIGLGGMYLGELTGLCRPEDLLRSFHYGTQLAKEHDLTIDSMMFNDIPGCTWGTVTAMSQAGIRYLSTGPNWAARIGNIMAECENKPFWWVSPSGREKVLVWVPNRGYAMVMKNFQLEQSKGSLSPRQVNRYLDRLDKAGFNYDITYIDWSGYIDNDGPDEDLPEFVRDWNAKYAYPKFVIATTTEAFRAFEAKYGEQLPVFRGDWTPYWEDGAGSTSRETALNRNTSDRLTQVETLFALRKPAAYPQQSKAFDIAWRNLMFYSEHTWGPPESVYDPDTVMARKQWGTKSGYALRAHLQTNKLLAEAIGDLSADAAAVNVYNTTSWPRTELVVLSEKQSAAGDRVMDAQGRPVPSQRLGSGELVFLASDVPMLGVKRYSVSSGVSHQGAATVTAEDNVLDNGLVYVRVDKQTGAVVELKCKDIENNFVDTSAGEAVNDYRFLPGDNLDDLQRNGPVKISVKEKGPLVASLLIESDAPGCHKLTREVRVTAGRNYVELINTVDRKRGAKATKPEDWDFAFSGGKESVNFAFPFKVDEGVMRLDIPMAVMQPEIDQIPGSCKNWLVVNRWVDVSNQHCGITWVTLDAPLIEVGAITGNLIGPETAGDGFLHDPDLSIWRQHIEPTQTLYSWVMNNHWFTNYRGYQEGVVTFRYVLRPHGGYDPAEASRFAVAFSQPLLVGPAEGEQPAVKTPFHLDSRTVLVIALKPSHDGKALIVRLFNVSDEDSSETLSWTQPGPKQVWLSDTSERPIEKIEGPISVPGWGVVTLRAELP